jgi:GNAT superfamily N-acetyltransferase
MPSERRARWRIEPFQRLHDRTAFDCGEPALNEYLARFARQNQDLGVARTFIAVPPDEPSRVIGYYTLAVGAMDRIHLPTEEARRFPRFPLPIARLARLGVDLSRQGQGLGEDLVFHALARALRIADEVGIIAVLIDAKNERAKAFYSRFDFEELPDQPLTLWLPLPGLRELFRRAR